MVDFADVNELVKRSHAMDRMLGHDGGSDHDRRTGDRHVKVHPYPLSSSAPEHHKKTTLMPGVTKLVNSVRRLKKAKGDDRRAARVSLTSDDEMWYIDGEDDNERRSTDKPSGLQATSPRAQFRFRRTTSPLSAEEMDSNTDESGTEHTRYSSSTRPNNQDHKSHRLKRHSHRVSFEFMTFPSPLSIRPYFISEDHDLSDVPESIGLPPTALSQPEQPTASQILLAEDIINDLVKKINRSMSQAEAKKKDLEFFAQDISDCQRRLLELDSESEQLLLSIHNTQERGKTVDQEVIDVLALREKLKLRTLRVEERVKRVEERGVAAKNKWETVGNRIRTNGRQGMFNPVTRRFLVLLVLVALAFHYLFKT